MGLDMRPMGKPKPGFEKRYLEIFKIISEGEIPKSTIFARLKGRQFPTEEELLKEWFDNIIPSYETIKAPQVGRDEEANTWVMNQYRDLPSKPPLKEYLKEYEGYYVVELAKERDGIPQYISIGQDKNVFRGQFLEDCIDVIGEGLVYEAWNTKLAEETLDYGIRLMKVAGRIAEDNELEYLKDQKGPPMVNSPAIEKKLHIVFALSKWLIFYGDNGHGYEADY